MPDEGILSRDVLNNRINLERYYEIAEVFSLFRVEKRQRKDLH